MRVRKLPVEVEAMQLTEESLDEIRFWMADGGARSYAAFDGSGLILPTLEGDMEARWRDWIIKGVHGEFYPCKPDIFEATYEVIA